MLHEKRVVDELSLLLNAYNGIFMNWLASAFSIAVVAVMFNTAAGVAFVSIRMLIVATAVSAILLYGCNECSTVHEESRKLKFLRQCHTSSSINTQWLEKSWKAWRPMRFQVGPFIHADKKLSMRIFSGILTNTASLLMEARLLRE